MNQNPFITYTAANFDNQRQTECASHTSPETPAREQGGSGGEHWPPRQPEGQVVAPTDVGDVEFQTIKRVLEVLQEGGLDLVGFLDALSWGNPLAVRDPTTRQARRSLMHSDRLATVVSRWLSPPRTSQGGPRAEGARRVLMPLIIDVVKEVISREMEVVVEELKEDSSAVTEQSVLGMVIEEIQEKVQGAAPVFCDLVKTAAWSKDQDGRNTLKDPTKVRVL